MSTCIVNGTLLDPSETAISGATVRFRLTRPVLNAATTALLGPKEISTTTATDGTWSLTLSRTVSGIITIDCPPDSMNSPVKYAFAVLIPSAATATFTSVLVNANE